MGNKKKEEGKKSSVSEKGIEKKLTKAEKEAAKKAAKSSKQASKSAKSASKKARKDGAISEDEDDIELIMKELAEKDAKKTSIVSEYCFQPSPRVNFSINAINGGELVLFGGEYFDGASNTCFNDLFRFDPKSKSIPELKTMTESKKIVSTTSISSSSSGASISSSDLSHHHHHPSHSLGIWRIISSPNTPSPRCSHQSVLLNSGSTLLIFGGEFGTANQFHHFNDTWKLDLATSKWSRLEIKKSPSPRSGHRMAAWRNFAVLFGGFHQTLTSDRWFGDLWLFDNRTDLWQEIIFPTSHSIPAPRSGAQFLVLPNKDCAILYGGYSEVRSTGTEGGSVVKSGTKGSGSGDSNLLFRKSKSVVHTDMWLLRLSPLLLATPTLPTWERIRAVGIPPSPRVGFTMSTWRDRLILFGGVLDKEGTSGNGEGDEEEEEEEGRVDGSGKPSQVKIHKKGADEIVRSTFYNDMYSFDLGRKRWYKLDLRKKKSVKEGKEGGTTRVTSKKRKDDVDVNKKETLGGDDVEDEIDLENEEEEEEEEEDDEDDDEDELGHKALTGGKKSAVDDLALYYYQDGKLVRMEEEEEEEEVVEEKEKEMESKTITGISNLSISNNLEGLVSSKSSDKEQEAVTAKELISAATVARREAEERARLVSIKREQRKIEQAEAALLQQKPAPLGRIRSGMWCSGNWLYIYGGLREETVKFPKISTLSFGSSAKKASTASLEKEITLDDMWRIDLRERTHWEMLLPGTMHTHAWREEPESDDDEEEDEGEDGEEEEEEEEGDDDEEDEEEDEDDKEREEEKESGVIEGGSRFHRAAHSKLSPEAVRLRLLRDKLALEEPERTPLHTEELRDFFARTQEFWIGEWLGSGSIKNGTVLAGKEVRHKAFKLSKGRYEQCWDLISELREAEEAVKAVEEAAEAERKERERVLEYKKGGKGGGGGGGGSKGKGKR
jgi:hypothetical protein